MMNTVRKSENLLPFPVISAAANGDTTAMCAILKHYEGYIAKLCTRTLKDDAGNTYSYVDEEMRNRLQVRLIKLLNRKESINMFSENLKAMRKAKGYTQEELAIKLNVTRQTISKWEKGLSVPDVDFLFKIADVLETNVGTLLGGAIMDEVNKDTVAEQLAKISEQLAIKNRRSKRIWKIVGIVLLTILALNLLLAIFGMSAYTSFSTDGKTTVIEMNEDSVSYEE